MKSGGTKQSCRFLWATLCNTRNNNRAPTTARMRYRPLLGESAIYYYHPLALPWGGNLWKKITNGLLCFSIRKKSYQTELNFYVQCSLRSIFIFSFGECLFMGKRQTCLSSPKASLSLSRRRLIWVNWSKGRRRQLLVPTCSRMGRRRQLVLSP